jgi:preprotein translocase subunit SecG
MLVVMMMCVVVMVICVVVHARGDDDVRSGDGDSGSGACSW